MLSIETEDLHGDVQFLQAPWDFESSQVKSYKLIALSEAKERDFIDKCGGCGVQYKLFADDSSVGRWVQGFIKGKQQYSRFG